MTFAGDTIVPDRIASLSGSFTLAAGQTFDLVNDKRANYYYDDTLFTGAFTGGIPEPGAWSLLIAGFGLTGAARRLRRPNRSVAA